MKCPFCGNDMTRMNESTIRSPERREGIYYCERHGVMNKGSDLKEKADQIARRV